MNAQAIRAGVVSDVLAERRRQIEKWGVQTHAPGQWSLILGEEYGEVCQAALESANLREELVQVAAVALAWAEQLDRESLETRR